MQAYTKSVPSLRNVFFLFFMRFFMLKQFGLLFSQKDSPKLTSVIVVRTDLWFSGFKFERKWRKKMTKRGQQNRFAYSVYYLTWIFMISFSFNLESGNCFLYKIFGESNYLFQLLEDLNVIEEEISFIYFDSIFRLQ